MHTNLGLYLNNTVHIQWEEASNWYTIDIILYRIQCEVRPILMKVYNHTHIYVWSSNVDLCLALGKCLHLFVTIPIYRQHTLLLSDTMYTIQYSLVVVQPFEPKHYNEI